MGEGSKKISFGFSKLSKKPTILLNKPTQEEKKIELIDCLEGQNIKIKDEVIEEKKLLVIPVNDNKKNLLERIKEASIKNDQVLKKEVRNNVQLKQETKKEIDERPDSELTLDELAARELIREAQNRLNNTESSNNSNLVLPTTLENDKEPTLDDYEAVPIHEFGKAMLRGMGWKDDDKSNMASTPELRPKGLGLGANKMVAQQKKATPVDENGKELLIVKNAYAKIIAGNHKGQYCQVQGLDDEASRVIVKTALKGEVLTLNEFLLVPVTKEEFSKESKVLNSAKYEEYKNIKNEETKQIKKEVLSSDESSDGFDKDHEKRQRSKRDKSKYRDRSRSFSRDRSRHNKHKSTRKASKSKYRDNYNSDSSDDSSSSERRHHHHQKKKKSKKSRDSSEDDYQRRRQKKKKSKKSHRKSSSSSDDSYRK